MVRKVYTAAKHGDAVWDTIDCHMHAMTIAAWTCAASILQQAFVRHELSAHAAAPPVLPHHVQLATAFLRSIIPATLSRASVVICVFIIPVILPFGILVVWEVYTAEGTQPRMQTVRVCCRHAAARAAKQEHRTQHAGRRSCQSNCMRVSCTKCRWSQQGITHSIRADVHVQLCIGYSEGARRFIGQVHSRLQPEASSKYTSSTSLNSFSRHPFCRCDSACRSGLKPVTWLCIGCADQQKQASERKSANTVCTSSLNGHCRSDDAASIQSAPAKHHSLHQR